MGKLFVLNVTILLGLSCVTLITGMVSNFIFKKEKENKKRENDESFKRSYKEYYFITFFILILNCLFNIIVISFCLFCCIVSGGLCVFPIWFKIAAGLLILCIITLSVINVYYVEKRRDLFINKKK